MYHPAVAAVGPGWSPAVGEPGTAVAPAAVAVVAAVDWQRSPWSKTNEQWQSESAMNSCKRCNGLTFLKLLVLNLHEKMRFKNAVFPSWCRHDNFSMLVALFSFILYTLRKIPLFCEGQGSWLNNHDFSEKIFMQQRHLKSSVFTYRIWSSVKPWLRRESTNWSWPWPLAETNGKIERAIESAGKRQNIWLHLQRYIIKYCNFMHYLL